MIGAEAPVVTLNYNKMIGFVEPLLGSPLWDLTGGRDVFFHFDQFKMPTLRKGCVRMRPPTEDEIMEWINLSLYKDRKVIHFNLSMDSKGRFFANSWTLKTLWDDKVKELLDRAN